MYGAGVRLRPSTLVAISPIREGNKYDFIGKGYLSHRSLVRSWRGIQSKQPETETPTSNHAEAFVSPFGV